MRILFRAAAFFVVAGAVLGGAANAADCRRQSLAQLRAASPGGFAIYRQTKDPAFFTSWIDCADPQYNLSTAVHESTHAIAAETDAFPLVGGGAIARPHEVSAFFPPARIARRFADDEFAAIYLRQGKASSATDFLYLLDELNAYTYDLSVAVDLRDLKAADMSVDHRDGLAAMMAFLTVYAEVARRDEPETWAGVRSPRAATTIRSLWSHAERVMASSCGIPNFGTNDRAYLARVCAGGAHAALAEVLGRAPVCPAACLAPGPDEAIGDAAGEVIVAPSRFTPQDDGGLRHPFGVQVGPPRHRLRDSDRR